MGKFYVYQCPNCGRTYRYEGDDLENCISCMNCRYPLKKIENIKTIRHPELNPMLSNNHVIGEIKNQNVPKCPTCQSTNIQRISEIERRVSVGIFGLFSNKINKSFQCKDCGYTW